MNIVVVTPPPFEPVTVAEMYEHLRWDADTAESETTIANQTQLGSATTVLGDWAGGDVFDEVNSVTVEVTNATLVDYSRESILNGTAPLYKLGDEFFYAMRATLVSPGVYTLTGLLRGRLGTESSTDNHSVGDALFRVTTVTSDLVYPLQDMISGYIITARQYVESFTRRALIRQTLRVTMPAFPTTNVRFAGYDDPSDWFRRPGKMELKRPPFISLVSVKYLDSDEVLQTLAPSNYYVDDASSLLAELVFRDTFDPSIATSERQDAVRVEYVAGYPPGDDSPETQMSLAANVPQSIKDAIKLHVQLMADRFDPEERAELERARDALLKQYQIQSF
jgi:hypothetical protein